ncbi:MAG TPA: hypothetical protein VH763_11970 [Gemmatimonadales bacterium]|jgi:hypothetical protein
MRRTPSVLGLSLLLGLLLLPLPKSRGVAARSGVPTLGQAGGTMAPSERPSATRLTAWLQGIRPRSCRLTSAATDVLAGGSACFPELSSVRFIRPSISAAFALIAAGERTLFPRAPPLSA